MAAKALITRWSSSPEARKAYERLLKTLTKGGEITARHSPFEPVDGLIDLRGIRVQERIFIKRVSGRGIDFSGCRLSWVWLEACHFEDVNFAMTDFSQTSDHSNSFRRCSFVGTNFKDGAFGYKGSSYADCNFEAADFRRAVFIRAEFDRCRFVNCKLKGMDFEASSFEDCAFVGLLQDVWFRGGFPLASREEHFGKPRKNRMKNVSFEKAQLWGLTVSDDCDLSTIRMPLEGDYRLYSSRKQRLERLQAAITSWCLGEEERRRVLTFVRSYLVHAEHEDWLLLNVDEIKQDVGEVLTTTLMRVLDSFA
jgi:fluoroquinolone resistance protein